jgi:hypothetical protein
LHFTSVHEKIKIEDTKSRWVQKGLTVAGGSR